MLQHARVIVIGAGPAGYTAAIYAARAHLEPLQFLGMHPGGQLMITTDVENYPGFRRAVQGPFLMEEMRAQAEHVGTRMVDETVESVNLQTRPFTCTTDAGAVYTCDSLIIATGAKAKWLGLPSEEKFLGYGVSGCATCDGFFFKNKPIAVVGGGNAAVEEALYLTHHASHITLIHRRDTLRAEQIAQKRLFEHPKISVLWNSTVKEILGTDDPKNVTGLLLQNTVNASEKQISVEGVFIAIGHTPMSHFLNGQLETDAAGYIMTRSGSTHTSVSGVFAAGDVQDPLYRQAVTSAGQGCMAALDAERFLNSGLWHAL